ncbi:MAG: acetate--CoA ligase family protein [Gemmataceae bacterium]
MKIERLHVYRGPNPWAGCPVVEIRFAGDVSVADANRVAAQAKALQDLVGVPVGFTAARKADDRCLAAVEFSDAALGQAACEIAIRMVQANATEPSEEELDRLKKLEYAQRLPPSVRVVYEGAKRHGIPIVKLSSEYSGYFVLGHGSKQKRLRWSEPDAVSGVARLASTDKYLTNQLLASIGVPVPKGKLISTVEEAWPAAEAVGLPVAVKPYNCDLQTGVSLDLRTRERVEAAFQSALEHSSWVMVEHFAPGLEHRVLVVGDKISAVTRIDPPHVIGDGKSTIQQLVDKTNSDPRRGTDDDHAGKPLSKIKIDDVALKVLEGQQATLDTVPEAGKTVLLRRDPPYFKNGGSLIDLTDVIHPETVAHVVAAARMMQIPVAGLDVVALDISKPLPEQGGVVVEINANPGLWLHMAPWADDPRPIGDDIAQWMFPNPDAARIPAYVLIDDETRTAERQLVAKLKNAGTIGIAAPGTFSTGARTWPAPAMSPQERTFVLLRNPAVDIAILHVTTAEIAEHGFPIDRCTAVITARPLDAAIRETAKHATKNALEASDAAAISDVAKRLG